MNDVSAHPFIAEEPARFSVREFMTMAQQPPLSDWCGKIELVEGVIVRMSPAGYPHFGIQRQIFRKLDKIFGDGLDGWIVGQELNVDMVRPKQSVREPDVCIFRDPGAIKGLVKSDALLLAVEVADSSLREDLGPKRSCYARAGIPHYWVVDVNAQEIHVMTDPDKDDYRTKSVVPFAKSLLVPGTRRKIKIS
jgi:Uma2 family endonuclease